MTLPEQSASQLPVHSALAEAVHWPSHWVVSLASHAASNRVGSQCAVQPPDVELALRIGADVDVVTGGESSLCGACREQQSDRGESEQEEAGFDHDGDGVQRPCLCGSEPV